LNATVIISVIGALVAAAIVAWAVLLIHTERQVKNTVPRLGAMPCPRCGVAIGAGPAAAIGAARAEEMRKLFEDAHARGVMLRVAPDWRFPCPACGAALKFDPGEARAALTEA
jgi:hypothetical protein